MTSLLCALVFQVKTDPTAVFVWKATRDTVGGVQRKVNDKWVHAGTCFTVKFGSKQYVVTAKHVTDGDVCRIVMNGGKIYNLTFKESPKFDLAAALMAGLKDVPMASTTPEVGDTVYSMGLPLSDGMTISVGIVNKFDELINGSLYLGHSASIAYGNSGGPLYNDKAQVVGVNVLIQPSFSHLNYAVPRRDLQSFLTEVGK